MFSRLYDPNYLSTLFQMGAITKMINLITIVEQKNRLLIFQILKNATLPLFSQQLIDHKLPYRLGTTIDSFMSSPRLLISLLDIFPIILDISHRMVDIDILRHNLCEQELFFNGLQHLYNNQSINIKVSIIEFIIHLAHYDDELDVSNGLATVNIQNDIADLIESEIHQEIDLLIHIVENQKVGRIVHHPFQEQIFQAICTDEVLDALEQYSLAFSETKQDSKSRSIISFLYSIKSNDD